MPDGAGDAGDARGGRTATIKAVADVVARQPGQPLDPVVRTRLEADFDRGLGDVRVHTDAEAAASARSVDASAWTVGNHIAFAAGHYAPGTGTGLRLLRHELSHVVQQGGRTPTAPTRLSSPGEAAERAADAVAAGAAPGAALVETGEAGVVHRQVVGVEDRATHGDSRDPQNPHNTLTAREMFRIWQRYWNTRLTRAVTHEDEVRTRIWSKDNVKYADDMDKFTLGLRSALGPEYQAAADELDACQAITSQMDKVLDWLEARQVMHEPVTFDQVNAKALESARAQAWFQTWMEPLVMGVLAMGSGPRTGPARVPEVLAAEPLTAGGPPAGPQGGTGFAGFIRNVLTAQMIGMARAEPVTQGPAAGGPPRAAVTEPLRPAGLSPSPAGGPSAVAERPTATVRPQQSTVAPPTAVARPTAETTARTAPPEAPAKASPTTSTTAPKVAAAGFDAAGRQRAAEKLEARQQAVAAADASVPSHRADQRSAQGRLLKQAGERPAKPASLKARLDRINRLPTYDDKVEAVRKLRREAGRTAEERAYLDWLSRNYALQHEVQDAGGAATAVTDIQLPAVTRERDAAQKALNQASKNLNDLMRSNGPNYTAAGEIQVDQVMSLAAWNAQATKPELATDHLVSLDRITKLPELHRLLAFYAQAPAEVQAVLRNELAALGDLPDNLLRMRADANGSSLKSNKSWADIPYAKAQKFGYSASDVDAVRAREARAYAEVLRRIEELTAKYTKQGTGRR
ncbi:DUF4157 domain-containing protein [Streptomyces sp. NPDC048417]|uniref:eCIS core domain-containing protein n=1 Tax=Streptomyces sp. NPDC048417 TaxID=3155387 RepID=UPI0034439867